MAGLKALLRSLSIHFEVVKFWQEIEHGLFDFQKTQSGHRGTAE